MDKEFIKSQFKLFRRYNSKLKYYVEQLTLLEKDLACNYSSPLAYETYKILKRGKIKEITMLKVKGFITEEDKQRFRDSLLKEKEYLLTKINFYKEKIGFVNNILIKLDPCVQNMCQLLYIQGFSIHKVSKIVNRSVANVYYRIDKELDKI